MCTGSGSSQLASLLSHTAPRQSASMIKKKKKQIITITLIYNIDGLHGLTSYHVPNRALSLLHILFNS